MNPRILVVDDQAGNLKLFVPMLGDDFEVSIATSGEQALRRISAGPLPDLILLDTLMPGIDGYEVCSRLKADARTSGIPVLFLSEQDGGEDESRGLGLGAVDFIQKPVRAAIMKARIRTHLEFRRCRDRLGEMAGERMREIEARPAPISEESGDSDASPGAPGGFDAVQGAPGHVKGCSG
ncbi:MAG: response regulator [Rectinemataceae bacterium]